MTYKRKTIAERLEKPGRRSSTFTKRRMGLFSKAADLCVLSDTQIAVLVKSVNDKHGHVYSFGHSNLDNVLDSFLKDSVPAPVNNLIQESGLDLYKQCQILKKDKHDDDDDDDRDRDQEEESSGEFWLELEKLDLENNSIEELSRVMEKLRAVKEDVKNRLSKIKSSCLNNINNSVSNDSIVMLVDQSEKLPAVKEDVKNRFSTNFSGLNNNNSVSNDSIVTLVDQSEKNVGFSDNVKRLDNNSCDDDGNLIEDFAIPSYGDWDASLYSLVFNCATLDDYSALGFNGGGGQIDGGGGSGGGDCKEKKDDEEFMEWLEHFTDEV